MSKDKLQKGGGIRNKFLVARWVVWHEEGRYPDVIIELMSPSTAAVEVIIGEKNPHHYLLDITKSGYNVQSYQVIIPFGFSPLDQLPVEVISLDVTIHTLNPKMVDIPF